MRNNVVDDFVAALSRRVRLVALDVGARGGAKSDLAILAPMTDYYLFEPDKEEFDRMRAAPKTEVWRSVTPINEALASGTEIFSLNLYRHRGCSSKLVADKARAERFVRGDYYIHDGAVNVPSKALDQLVSEGVLPPPSFMKIDVQGMESEVFSGAQECLRRSLVGIRTEVSFYPIYEGQPLFAEIDQQLRVFGFVPMRWIESHEWRRQTRVKFPGTIEGPFPASRGQLIHGDVLYLLEPEALPSGTEDEIKRLVLLGMTALAYGHIDHAVSALSRPGVESYLREVTGMAPRDALAAASKHLARRLPSAPLAFQGRRLVSRLRRLLWQ